MPSENFRFSRADVSTYGAELGLDHLHSRLSSLGGAVIEGRRLDYEKFAAEELANLDEIELELGGREMPEEVKERFESYISGARSLLAEMKNPFSASGAV